MDEETQFTKLEIINDEGSLRLERPDGAIVADYVHEDWARLLWAAPNLLTLSKQLLSELETAYNGAGSDMVELFDSAREAITIAEGKV